MALLFLLKESRGRGRRIEREEENPESRGGSGGVGRTVVMEAIELEHHVVKILLVRDRDERVEIFARELVLDANLIGGADGGELGVEISEAHGTVDGEDLGLAVEVGELIVVRSGLDPAAVADHELDAPSGGGGGGGGWRRVVGGGGGPGGGVVAVAVVGDGVDLARSRRGVAGVGEGGVRVVLHPCDFPFVVSLVLGGKGENLREREGFGGFMRVWWETERNAVTIFSKIPFLLFKIFFFT